MNAHPQLEGPEGARLLGRLRQICSSLPETTEVVDGFGHTTFKVAGKSFIIAGAGEKGHVVSLKCDPATQAHLIRRGPFYRTPYIGQHGWISLPDPLAHDADELTELIVDGYRRAAPRRLAKRV